MKKLLFILLSYCLIFSSCKKTPTTPEMPEKHPPVINFFKAEPSQIKYGESSTLSWDVSNATTVEIDHGIGQVPLSGSTVVKPESDTTYTLTAKNIDGTSTKTCTIKVEAIANVIMIEGPIFEDGYSLFTYKGIVKNIGNKKAEWVKIYIYIRKSNGDLITFDYSYADDYELDPGETSPWDVLFWDPDKKIRNSMDKSKTTYEIKWE